MSDFGGSGLVGGVPPPNGFDHMLGGVPFPRRPVLLMSYTSPKGVPIILAQEVRRLPIPADQAAQTVDVKMQALGFKPEPNVRQRFTRDFAVSLPEVGILDFYVAAKKNEQVAAVLTNILSEGSPFKIQPWWRIYQGRRIGHVFWFLISRVLLFLIIGFPLMIVLDIELGWFEPAGWWDIIVASLLFAVYLWWKIQRYRKVVGAQNS